MEYLPSKKILVVVITAVIFVWVAAHNSNSQNLVAKEQSGVFVAHAEPTQPDADSDGLSDWEEWLFGTKINDPDSDNDGVSDGEEFVSLKNIPRIRASDSPLNYISEINNALASAGSFDPTSSLTTETISYSDQYATRDISIVSTEPITIAAYVNTVLRTIGEHPDIVDVNALEIIQRWLETHDQSDLDAITQLSDELKTVSDELLLTTVPSDIVDIHLTLINNLYAEAQTLKTVYITNSNPVQGFLNTAQYASYRDRRGEAIIDLTQYFNNINFNQG